MRGDAAGDVLAEAGREHDGADEEGDEEGVDEPVLLQELVQPLVAPHPQHVPTVQVDVEGAAEPAEDADEGEDEELHGVEGERHLEGGHEHGHDRLLLLGEDGQQAEHQRPVSGGHDQKLVTTGNIPCTPIMIYNDHLITANLETLDF